MIFKQKKVVNLTQLVSFHSCLQVNSKDPEVFITGKCKRLVQSSQKITASSKTSNRSVLNSEILSKKRKRTDQPSHENTVSQKKKLSRPCFEKTVQKPPKDRKHRSNSTQCPSKDRHAEIPLEFQLDLLLINVKNRHPSWTTNTPYKEWSGVVCNDHDEIVAIEWQGRGLRGTLDWNSLPRTLLHLDLAIVSRDGGRDLNYLEGEIIVTELPPQLRSLVIGDNRFTGTPDLTQLPSNLKWLDFAANKLSGVVDLSKLPSNLRQLHLNFNDKLEGELWKKDLPKTVDSISIEGTKIVEIETEERSL